MTRLYFVRHGQSVANAGGVTLEHAIIPLSPLGLAQAAALAEWLDVPASRVFTSDYARARETARPFCERLGLPAEVHLMLHEFSALDPALLEGMMGAERRPIANAYWLAADPFARHGPQSESFVQFAARVDAFIEDMHRLPDCTVLFGHGIWFALLFWRLMGFSAGDSESMAAFRRFQGGLSMPNCAVYRLEGDGQGAWTYRADERLMRRMAMVQVRKEPA